MAASADIPVKISFVVPVYGCPDALEELHARIHATCGALAVEPELVMVDDCCPRGSWAVLQKLAAADPAVRAVRLSRNFGQHPAIQAGLRQATGDWIVVMDCDLQDQPEELAKLYARAKEGAHVVRAVRSQRQDSPGRRLISWLFYKMLSWLTGVEHRREIANFGIYSRKAIDALISWNEIDLYFPAAIQWVGFRSADVDIQHAPRKHGKSSYSFGALLRLSMSVIIAFSDKPLRLAVQSGFFVSALSFAMGLTLFVSALMRAFTVPGWATIVVSIFFVAGVIIAMLGFVGLYVGQVLRQVKGRPNFIIDEIALLR